MKVLLVLPWHLTDRSYRSRFSTLLTYASTTLGTIAAIIENVRPDWQIDTIDEMSEKIDYRKDYDIVMLTASTPTAVHAYDIADRFRSKGACVCMGGYHVKYMYEEALEHVDSVIIGLGEYSIPQFIEDFEAGHPKPTYDNNCVAGKDILSPDRTKISTKKYLKYPGVIANPMCPNRCAFCAISDLWRNATARPVENVVAEIKSLKKKIIIFFDPNFFGNREYSIELMKALIPLKIRWAGSATIDVGFDDELLSLAQKSGCNGLLFGLETFSQDALKKVGKVFNDVDKYKDAIDNIKRYGIMVNGCFVLGMDHDTKESLMELPKKVDELGINLARFSILTPAPGSGLYRKMERDGRIINKNWADYTQHKTVFLPENMTPEELDEIYRYVWKETYSYKNILKRVRRITTGGLLARFVGFGANLGFKFLGME